MVMSGSNSTVRRKRYSVTLNKSGIVMTDMEEQLCKVYELIFKAPVVTGKISGVLS